MITARKLNLPPVRTRSWGPQLLASGGVRFRIWAPGVERISLLIDGEKRPFPMLPTGGGWYELSTPRAYVGSRYWFVLEDGLRIPDPASHFQPDDVGGPSEVVDHNAYRWRVPEWSGRQWNEAVIYEMHVGCFTDVGTFRAASTKLRHLAELGVTAIELMPVGDFPGTRNWGYDGVLPYAPDASYGRPEDLQAFVDAAHELDLMVILDVVYNHFGPEGNYLHRLAPKFFTERHKTPWGAAINFDGAHSSPVREFFIENALYWLEEFRFDGLRFDAVHALVDDSPRHVLDELAETIRERMDERPVHLILENEENEATRLMRDPAGRPVHYTAQWNDDLHHVLHTAATGELAGYYGDYRGDDHKLGRALAEGFAFQGEHMVYRDSPRGEPSAHLAPDAFIAFIQNHDQIGNRAFGERLSEIAPLEALRAVVAVYLLLPQIPMLFMGEEWGTSRPFPFFCDFHGELGDAVRMGRREEFARFPEFQDPAQRERIPDPQSPDTFASAKLDWGELTREPHRSWLEWYQRLLAVRAVEIAPRLPRIEGNAGKYEIIGPSALIVRWAVGDSEELVLLANLCHTALDQTPAIEGRLLWQEGEGGSERGVPPWTVQWWIRAADRSAPA
jgi:malto-oligosyltrehalose trehalohydrolase